MNLGDKITQLRKFSNLSQVQLAEKLNVPCQSIVKWEINESVPDLDKLISISKLYNVTLDELVKDETENESGNQRINIESLVEKNREIQKKTILLLSGFISILVSSVAIIILAVVDEAIVSLKYMIYRYNEVGEYVNAPISYTIPYIVLIVIFCIGLICFLIGIKFQKK
jgi:transcriptional regulator with XRE-family HTH domain